MLAAALLGFLAAQPSSDLGVDRVRQADGQALVDAERVTLTEGAVPDDAPLAPADVDPRGSPDEPPPAAVALRPSVSSAPREPFPFLVSVSYEGGFPLNGVAFGVAIRERWHVKAGVGMALPFVLSLGTSASVSRGLSLGRIATLAPGLVFDGFWSRFCGAGGCGRPHHFMGVGPTMALHMYIPSVRRFWLGVGGGAGVTFAVSRQRMGAIQPHLQLVSVTAGLRRRRRG